MNWDQAIEAMKAGHSVRRKSETKRQHIGESSDGIPIYDCGREATRLAAAWTVDDKPVMVFQGAGSKVLSVPEDDDRSATDWEICDAAG